MPDSAIEAWRGQAPSFLPQAAPFAPHERAQLDAVLGIASPIQRSWLAGFLAGLEARSGGPETVAAPALATTPLTILFASESGNAEALAHRAAKVARRQGFKPRVLDFAELDIASLANERNLLIVAATWGEGEPPARAVTGFAGLMSQTAPRLDGVRFSVLALGDTAYAEFCAIGRRIDARLEELGATRIADRVDCDLDFEEPASAWIGAALASLAPVVPTVATAVRDDMGSDRGLDAEAVVVDHVNLNSSRSDKETIHLALGFSAAMPQYEPGDSFEVFAENDPAQVDQVLAATGLSADGSLREVLLTERDITTLSVTAVERFARTTGDARVAGMIADGDIRSWVAGRQLIDLLEEFPATLAAQQLMDVTRKLPPRAYSIASSRREYADEAHLLVARVRYTAHGRQRAGVASTYLADGIRNGAQLKVRLKPNLHFRLPADPATDIIMIGPGTGVAPFRAFVQDRRATGAPGRSWLLFGDRHFTHDFLYQLEWQDALEDGSLSRLDVAFSRDQPEKIYVQDRLFEHRRALVDWIESGASVYVCGDAKAMAKDVRSALVRAYSDVKMLSTESAESEVARLERDRRYLQDVY